jgi:hypothetical protein
MQLFHCSPMRESWLMELGLGIPAECWKSHMRSPVKPTFAKLNDRVCVD